MINRNKKTFILLSIIFLMLFSLQALSINQDTRPYELEYWDKKLNECYKKIMNELELSDRIKLKKAQRQWIIFRDLDCKWAFSGVALNCAIYRTIERAEELKETDFFDKKGNYVSIGEN